MDNLSKRVKILVGLLTLWPLVWMATFFILVFLGITLAATHSGGGTGDAAPPIWFFAIIIPHIFTILVWNALTIFYIVHVIVTKRIADNNIKALWAVMLLLFNIVIMPVYWYLYIWHEPTQPVPARTTVE